MKSQKRTITKIMKTVIEKSLTHDANSASCIVYYQPKAPAALKKFSKVENDK